MKKSEKARVNVQQAIIKAWRVARLPRLYWRKNNPGMEWYGKEIAMCRNGALRTSFDTLYAISEYIEEQAR